MTRKPGKTQPLAQRRQRIPSPRQHIEAAPRRRRRLPARRRTLSGRRSALQRLSRRSAGFGALEIRQSESGRRVVVRIHGLFVCSVVFLSFARNVREIRDKRLFPLSTSSSAQFLAPVVDRKPVFVAFDETAVPFGDRALAFCPTKQRLSFSLKMRTKIPKTTTKTTQKTTEKRIENNRCFAHKKRILFQFAAFTDRRVTFADLQPLSAALPAAVSTPFPESVASARDSCSSTTIAL